MKSPEKISESFPPGTADATTFLPRWLNWPESHHLWDGPSYRAVYAALACGRPLLLRGDPGTGKTQLARAAAVVLKRPFLWRVVNARMEPEDALYRYDAVARLSDAQAGAGRGAKGTRAVLDPLDYLMPDVLWWAFAPDKAREQHARAARRCGAASGGFADMMPEEGKEPAVAPVVLIDEIDKADSDVPNSLLEVLSSNGFQLPFGGGCVQGPDDPSRRPLIFITTNEDRELPSAFLRRCLVHQMDLPDNPAAQSAQLKARVRAHEGLKALPEKVVDEAIEKLLEDREAARAEDVRMPGLAELIDLLRVIEGFEGTKEQVQAVEDHRHFTFRKHRRDGSRTS